MTNQNLSISVINHYSTKNDVGIAIIPAKARRRRIHRVPPHLRVRKQDVYDPVVVSLGPYHHGQPQLAQVEEFKHEILNMFVSRDELDKNLLHEKIMERIDEIRRSYVGVSRDEWPDKTLAEMMLGDACFIMYYIIACVDYERDDGGDYRPGDHIISRLGMWGATFLTGEVLKLENQIPLWVVRLLIHIRYGPYGGGDHDGDPDELIYKFLSFVSLGDPYRLTCLPRDEESDEEPFHLLEAARIALFKEKTMERPPPKNKTILPRIFRFGSRRAMLGKWRDRPGGPSASSDRASEFYNTISHPFRSATDLKAKGIHFRPSSHCLTDIRFHSGLFSGRLQLPIWFIGISDRIFISNAIAFEMSPETNTESEVKSYINFMKSLIETPGDVKELRRTGILFSDLGNDEDVVRMFKEIETYGCDNIIFNDVKMRMEAHCNSKAKTWTAELLHTYFLSPWTTIALFAAAFLLCLTFLQTYYAINPR